MINIPGINSVRRATSAGNNLGIIAEALGVFIDPYNPFGFKGTLVGGDDVEEAQYPSLAPGIGLTLTPFQKIGPVLQSPYTSATKYYSDGGASFESNSPYYYQGNAVNAGSDIAHFSIWIKPDSNIDSTSTFQVPLMLEASESLKWYIALGNGSDALTDEYISIVGPGTKRTGVTTGGVLAGNTWVNIAFNWGGSYYKIFVNNVECGNYVSSSGIDAGHVPLFNTINYQLTLGALTDGPDEVGEALGGRNFFEGKMSVYIQYSQPLTTQEMTHNFNYFKSRFGL